MYIELQNEKRGKWSSAKPVLSYNKASGVVSVPGQNGRKINAAVEDVRFTITEDELAIKIQEAVDALDIIIDESVDELPDNQPELGQDEVQQSDNGEMCPTLRITEGDRIDIYWSGDEECYPATIGSFHPDSGKHEIDYYDGDKDTLDMQTQVWLVINTDQAVVSDISPVWSEALEFYFKTFGHKEFMLHQAERLPPHPVWNAYKDKEVKFMKTVREVSVKKFRKAQMSYRAMSFTK